MTGLMAHFSPCGQMGLAWPEGTVLCEWIRPTEILAEGRGAIMLYLEKMCHE